MTRRTVYLAYLLRVTRVEAEEEVIWRISLENPETRQRTCFASLPGLCGYLERVSGQAAGELANGDRSSELERDREK